MIADQGGVRIKPKKLFRSTTQRTTLNDLTSLITA